MSLELLKDILKTPTYCGREEYIIAKITEHLMKMSLDYTIDEHGNIYVTKGVSDIYPCVVAHTDSVHRIVDIEIVEHDDDKNIIYAIDKSTGKKTGCGGDNKAGVYVCLELLKKIDVLKVAFFVSEEYGCFGSILSDETFYDNVGYCLQFDAPENNWVTHYCNGVKLFDENGDFYETIKPILDDYMGDYTLDRHPYTDVSILGAFYDFSCINYSVGYYNMHSPNEFVNVEHVNQAKNMAIEMISSLGNIKYQFIDQNASKMDKNRLREYALKSLTSLRK